MSAKKKVAIVIPVYQTALKWNEQISLARCKEAFKGYDVIIVYPEGLSLTEYEEYNAATQYLGLKPKYFKSVATYSRLMNIPYFYKHFLEYDYILIYQLDTFVFENNLDEWCNKGFDYIGAPWINSNWIEKLNNKLPGIKHFIKKVGNGGLSLRKVKKFYYGSIYLYPLGLIWKRKWNEDFFWSSVAKRLIPGFRIPDVKTALQFAFEETPEVCYELNGNQLPFGCHAWEKFNPAFWAPHFERYGYIIPDSIKNQQTKQ